MFEKCNEIVLINRKVTKVHHYRKVTKVHHNRKVNEVLHNSEANSIKTTAGLLRASREKNK